jgi:hypothetical protein
MASGDAWFQGSIDGRPCDGDTVEELLQDAVLGVIAGTCLAPVTATQSASILDDDYAYLRVRTRVLIFAARRFSNGLRNPVRVISYHVTS